MLGNIKRERNAASPTVPITEYPEHPGASSESRTESKQKVKEHEHFHSRMSRLKKY